MCDVSLLGFPIYTVIVNLKNQSIAHFAQLPIFNNQLIVKDIMSYRDVIL